MSRLSLKTNFLWRSLLFLRPHWKPTLGAYSATICIILVNILIPQLISWIVDRGIQGQNIRLLLWSCTGLLGLGLGKAIFTFKQGQWNEIASQNVAYDVRNKLQQKLTVLSFSYYDRSEVGQLLARAIQDVERIRFLTGRATLRILEGTLLLLGTSLVLWWMNPRLSLLLIGAMPLLVFLAYSYGQKYRPLSLLVQAQVGKLTSIVEQTLRGIQVVKTYAQEKFAISQFDHHNEDLTANSIKAARLQAINVPLLFLTVNLGVAFVIWYGGKLVIGGQLSLGELIAFTAYLGQLIEPVRRLGMVIPALVIAQTAAQRVFEILDAIPDIKDGRSAFPLPAIQGSVRFDSVSFSYGKRPILNHIDFDIMPGQVAALFGPTGSGKSSIVNLIPRFYDPTSGKILIDGIDIHNVTLQSLRSQIGIVMQETTLFAASIRENITIGKSIATEDEIIAAAIAAQAHDFIMQMPNGYDTLVGEKGITLSGGQKQRLAIARSIILNPRILILDDATSSVDSETEHAIQLAIERLIEGRTTFIVAHRLSTLMRSDVILVMDKGELAARGTHAELMQKSLLYQQIYLSQCADLKNQSDTVSLSGAYNTHNSSGGI